MKLRKLARLCEHDEIKRHYPPKGLGNDLCPGGVFLPDDTLIIEKENGEWPDWALAELNEPPLWAYNRFDQLVTLSATVLLNGLVETALTVREAE